jgi:NTP pyrophosphatase (non-canonical NTP hydrolase)
LDLDALTRLLRQFAEERDWDQFHTPKNLAMALAGEAGELLEVFQWLTPTESASLPAQSLEAARQEMADVLIYLVRLADKLSVDLEKAAHDKIRLNADKYPVHSSRGNALKQGRAAGEPG